MRGRKMKNSSTNQSESPQSIELLTSFVIDICIGIGALLILRGVKEVANLLSKDSFFATTTYEIVGSVTVLAIVCFYIVSDIFIPPDKNPILNVVIVLNNVAKAIITKGVNLFKGSRIFARPELAFPLLLLSVLFLMGYLVLKTGPFTSLVGGVVLISLTVLSMMLLLRSMRWGKVSLWRPIKGVVLLLLLSSVALTATPIVLHQLIPLQEVVLIKQNLNTQLSSARQEIAERTDALRMLEAKWDSLLLEIRISQERTKLLTRELSRTQSFTIFATSAGRHILLTYPEFRSQNSWSDPFIQEWLNKPTEAGRYPIHGRVRLPQPDYYIQVDVKAGKLDSHFRVPVSLVDGSWAGDIALPEGPKVPTQIIVKLFSERFGKIEEIGRQVITIKP
jgi:hypothetical protein